MLDRRRQVRSSGRGARACPPRRGSGERREADEVGEEDGDEPALRGRAGLAGAARRRDRRRAMSRTRRRTSVRARSDDRTS